MVSKCCLKLDKSTIVNGGLSTHPTKISSQEIYTVKCFLKVDTVNNCQNQIFHGVPRYTTIQCNSTCTPLQYYVQVFILPCVPRTTTFASSDFIIISAICRTQLPSPMVQIWLSLQKSKKANAFHKPELIMFGSKFVFNIIDEERYSNDLL